MARRVAPRINLQGLAADDDIEKELAKMKAAAYHDQAHNDKQSQS